MRETRIYHTTIAALAVLTTSHAFTISGLKPLVHKPRNGFKLKAAGNSEQPDNHPITSQRWTLHSTQKSLQARFRDEAATVLSISAMEPSQNLSKNNPAALSNLKKQCFQWGIPLLGATLGAVFAESISSRIFNCVATNGINVAAIMFLGGFGGKIADALDDDGIWDPPKYSSPLNKICRTILELSLHFGTFLSAVFTSTWSNPVPFAMLSAMYSYAVLVRGKAVPDFENKRGEAIVITLCLLPLFGMVGARMATSPLYTSILIASFLSTFVWLKKVNDIVFFQRRQGLTSAITTSGIFRALPLLAMVPFGLTGALLSGMAIFYMDTLGWTIAKFCSLSNFRNRILKYGMVASGVAWSSSYAIYAILRQYPFSFPTVSYNLTWEAFFSLEKTVFATEKKLSVGAIAPILWFLFDIFMILRCEGLFNRAVLKLFGSVACTVTVLFALLTKGKIRERFSNDFKYSSFLNAIYLLIESKMMLAADPTNALKKFALFGIALGNIFGAVRSIWRVNTNNLKYSYWTPVILACILQGGFEIGSLAIGL